MEFDSGEYTVAMEQLDYRGLDQNLEHEPEHVYCMEVEGAARSGENITEIHHTKRCSRNVITIIFYVVTILSLILSVASLIMIAQSNSHGNSLETRLTDAAVQMDDLDTQILNLTRSLARIDENLERKLMNETSTISEVKDLVQFFITSLTELQSEIQNITAESNEHV